MAFASTAIASENSVSFARTVFQQVQQLLESKTNHTISIDGANENLSQNAFVMPLTPCPGGSGVIGGKAVGDFNYNGIDDQDAGIAGIEVFLYGCGANGASTLIGSTTTDGLGDYFFNGLTDGEQYRLEFVSRELLNYNDGFSGSAGGPSVQFITAPTCGATASFAHPQDFCEENPGLAATCFVNGDPLPPTSEAANIEALVYFNWEDEGNSVVPTKLADAAQIGSAYGVAYDRENQQLYTSAFIKRFVGMGTLGIGGIYTMSIDPNNPSSAVPSSFVNVQTLGINVGTISPNAGRGLPTQLEDPSNDAEAYNKVATEGIGGIAFNDGKLWMVNLFEKSVHSIVVDSDNNPITPPTAADVETFPLPNPGCTGGNFRPFAINVFRDVVYVGGVCDAMTSQNASDLEAFVYQLNGSSWTEIMNFTLDYDKGYAANAGSGVNECEDKDGWFPWLAAPNLPPSCNNDFFYIYPTPVLSDIEFDIDGSMILGFMDRMGHQLGNKNWPLTGSTPLMTNVSGGDILRAHFDGTSYTLESNGTAGDLTGMYVDGANTFTGVGNSQGPGGGEFYFQDIFNFPVTTQITPHAETSQGDLAFYPGSGRIATTTLDPLGTVLNSGGVNYMSNTTGQTRFRGYRLFQTSNSSISTFSKANGLGALQVFCGLNAPLEIGGYIWNDDNEDGVQDACETALGNVNLTLISNDGTVLGTTTTNARGEYYFNTSVLDASELLSNTTYHIIAGTGGQFDPQSSQLNNNFFLTNQDVGGGQTPDKTDSDAAIAGSFLPGNFAGYPYISILTSGNGYINHSLDFGFTATNVNPVSSIGGTVFEDTNMNGLNDDGGGVGIGNVTVELYDGDFNLVATTISAANGDYSFPAIAFGDYSLTFILPANSDFVFSPGNVGGDDTIDSDPDPNTGQTATFAFDPDNGNDDTRDAGLFVLAGDISGSVFQDNNGDGIQDAGENGIQGVNVILRDADDNNAVIATVFSAADGSYTFMGIDPGNYVIEFDETTNLGGVTNYQGSPQNQGGDDTLDSDADSATGFTDVINFDPTNGGLDDVDAGFFATAAISGFAWNDFNQDGLLNNGENGIGGVLVTLFDGDGNQIMTTTTNVDGSYSFTNNLAGDYYVVFNAGNTGADYESSPQNVGNNDSIDSDADPISGQTATFSFDPTAGNDNSVSAGFFIPAASIGGFVFNDLNGNGLQDAGETGIAGVTVLLLDADNGNATILNTMTNATGNYAFTQLAAGNYIVEFDISTNTANLDNFNASPQNQGNGSNDSDPNPANNQTDVIAFDPLVGDNNEVDAGYFQTAAISGVAFGDANEDGIFNPNELGIEDVTVTLFDADGNEVASVLTSSDGSYAFDNQPAGDYYVVFNPSSTGNNDLDFTNQNAGNDDSVDSDADPVTGQTMTFSFDPTNGGDNTVSAGFTLPFGSVGDRVFKDCNQNGIQDADETGIPNAQVTLTSVGPNPSSVSVLTNSDGFYMFMNVQSGQYILAFAPPSNAVGLDYTIQDAGNNDELDSDVDPLTGLTMPFNVNGGGMMTSIDAGFIDAVGPFITNIPDVTIECDEDITSFVKAIDNCDDNPGLSFEDVSVDGACPALIIREWTATDACGNVTTNQQKITTNDTTAPTITFSNPLLQGVQNGGSVTIECDLVDNIALTDAIFADNCDMNLTTTAVELPVEIGNCEDDGFIQKRTLTWTAEDDCGNFTEISIMVFITDTTPPEVAMPSDLTVDCNSIPPVPVLFVEDNCDNDVTIDFEEVILGDTCEIYKIVRSWFIYDHCLNATWVQQKILVQVDELAILDSPEDITISCEEPKPAWGDISVSSNCFDFVIDTSTQLLEDPCLEKCIRIWKVTDDCGDMVTATQLITVVDTTAPVLQFVHPELVGLMNGDSITMECDNATVFDETAVAATDNCNDIEINFMEMVEIGDCDEDGYLVRMECCWKAEDVCGNQSELCLIVRINDLTKPELVGIPNDTLINQAFEDVPLIPSVTATDNCDNDLDIEFFETEIADGDGCGKTITRTWIATDDCGNSCSDSQIITVDDVCDCPDIVLNGVNVQNADCGQANGSITADVTVDPTIYDYILIPNTGEQGAGPNEFINLAPGSYILIINLPDFPDCDEKIFFDIEEEDCIDFLQVTIEGEEEVCLTANELDFNGVITSTEIFQAGSTATVECTNIDGECITLSPGVGFTGTSPDQIGVVHCFNNNPNQCDTTYINVFVEQAQIVCALKLDDDGVVQPDCDGNLGSINLSVSGNVGDIIYTWTPNVSTTNSASNLAAGSYQILIKDTDTDCEIDTTIIISPIQPTTLSSNVLNMSNILCFGENTGSITSNNGEVYTVSTTNGVVGQTPLTNLPAGIYSVSENTGTCTSFVEVEITQGNELSVSFTATPEGCLENDGSITLTASGGTGAYTYTWSPAVSTSEMATELSASQTYSVTVSDDSGCETILDNLTIAYDCQPCNLQLTIADQQNENCANMDGSVELAVANQNGNVTYVWTPAVSTNNVAFGLSEGTYNVVATDEFGCETSIAIDIDRDLPTWSAEGSSTAANCAQSDGTASVNVLNGTGNYTYEWSPNVSTTNSAANLASGTYDITVTDENACQSMLSIEVENVAITWTASMESTATSCGENNGFAVVSIDNPNNSTFTYDWSDNVSVSDSAQNLAAGSYAVTVTDENGCEAFLTAEIAPSTPGFNAIAVINDATCAGNDGSIVLNVNGTGMISYEWSNQISTTNMATGLSPGELYSVTITSDNGCSMVFTDLSIDLNCTQNPSTEEVFVACGMTEMEICVSLAELPADLNGVTVLTQPQNGALGFVNDTCFTYQPTANFFGLDTIALIACDLENNCDTSYFNIEVEECNVGGPCSDFIAGEEVIAQGANCDGLSPICLTIPLADIQTYEIYDNGVEYINTFEGCLSDTVFTYDFGLIPDDGQNGPYDFTWSIDGAALTGTFQDLDGLVLFMNTNDPTGNWIIEMATFSIRGGNSTSTYGDIMVTQTDSGAQAGLFVNTNIIPTATNVMLSIGTHELIFIDENACQDTLIVDVFCVQSENVTENILIGNTATYCFGDPQVIGTAEDMQVSCDNCDNVSFVQDGDCVTFTGDVLGTDEFTLVICDENDICDTVFLTVNVTELGLLPDANIDGDTTQIETGITIDVLANDEINGDLVSIDIIDEPINGTAQLVGTQIIYTPNEGYCGLDAFSYEICNATGCDIATVNLLVECSEDDPIPVTGFSPNGDGVNDGFMIKNLSRYPDNELIIFNRWGTRVHYDVNYSKGALWRGTYRNLFVPDGTYFYIFRYKDGREQNEKVMKGYVQIAR